MSSASFPTTLPSVIQDVLAADPERVERGRAAIAAAYWEPVNAYLRRRWQLGADESRDLTQDFFLQAFSRGLFERYDPSLARLGTWVRRCVDSTVKNAFTAGDRLKRGGDAVHIALDDAGPHLGSDDEHEAWFEREWLRALFADALAALEAESRDAGRAIRVEVFRAADIDTQGEAPGYRALAERFAIPVTQVTNHLHWARRRFRGHVLDRLRAQCRSDEEFKAEARAVFGVDP